MTKTEFQELLHRFTSTSRSEAEHVLQLKREYPYSQVLHSLAARLSKDHSLAEQQTELQLAAVYSADRHVLKEIMSQSGIEVKGRNNYVSSASMANDGIDYAEEIMHDLEELHKLKHNFEMLFVDIPKQEIKKTSTAKKQSTNKLEKNKRQVAKVSRPLKKKIINKIKSKTQSVKQVKKSAAKQTIKSKTKVKKGKGQLPKPIKKKLQSGDELIAQIEISKKKITPENPRQREQIKIIDQFIEAQPSISQLRNKNNTNTLQPDLTSLQPGEFGEQIISETLVNILLNQGKTEKAIEVLKKLIWKFPQKKAYFAAQIQELKK